MKLSDEGRWEFHPWEHFEGFSLWHFGRASGVEGVLLLGAAAARAAPGVDAEAVRRVIIPDFGPYRKEQLLAILRERHSAATRGCPLGPASVAQLSPHTPRPSRPEHSGATRGARNPCTGET